MHCAGSSYASCWRFEVPDGTDDSDGGGGSGADGALLLGPPERAGQRAFDTYAAAVEKRLAQQHASPDTYLASLNVGAPSRADLERQLRVRRFAAWSPSTAARAPVTGGLLHHWRGVAFVPGGRASRHAGVAARLQPAVHLLRA